MEPIQASAIASAVNNKQLSALESGLSALARLHAYDAVQPQTWILRATEADVSAQAKRVDERIAAGEFLPLAGVPFAVKDNIDVAGWETTVGCPAFAFHPQDSAQVVTHLINAGAILLGKTNLDQFATGLNGTRSPYGAPGCVFNREYVSGGSSSGSAVSVGAGIVAFALGTDTAGSGRVPAAFNGLYGLKPTRGRWSNRGVFPACKTLDCVTVFAHTVEDADLVDSVLCQFDDADPYSRKSPPPAAVTAPKRIGVPRPDQRNFLGDHESAALFEQAIVNLISLGCEIIEVDIAPLLAAAQLLYAGPWVAERLAAIQTFIKQMPSAVHPVVRAITQGGFSISGVDTFQAMYKRQEYARYAEQLWEHIDTLLLPTTPTAYRISELEAEPVTLNSNLGLYTNFVNLLDMSAISIPAGFRANGTGFGVTFIAPAWHDPQLLALARQFEARIPVTPRPPCDLTPRPQTIRIAAVGAHLSGLPLNWQLTSRHARLVGTAKTAPKYRLYAMNEKNPQRPALAYTETDGASIALEIYELDAAAFGSFVNEVTAPLAIGRLLLDDGTNVNGFIGEPRALIGAEDVTAFGGWRAYLASKA